jgi:hypothetical protein
MNTTVGSAGTAFQVILRTTAYIERGSHKGKETQSLDARREDMFNIQRVASM